MSITKRQLDDYYTEHYDRLYAIITGITKRNKKRITTEMVLSECYLNMMTKLDKIKPDKIGHFITSYARTGTSFSNNPLSVEERFNYTRADFVNTFSAVVFDGYDPDLILEGLTYFEEDYEESMDSFDYIKQLEELVESFKTTLNVVDKLIAEPLLDILLDSKYDIKEHFIGEDEDSIKYYKKTLSKIKIKFKDYAKRNNNLQD